MKIRGNIFLMLMLLLLSGCLSEPLGTDDDGLPETRGVMEIEILQEAGETEDKMNTIRFLVFKQTAGFPELELNKLFEVPAPITTGEASRLGIILEVSRKQNADNKKILVAIVNEPQGMNPQLNALRNFSELQDVRLSFAHFLNQNHIALSASGNGLPMTGVIETQAYATEGEATTNRATMELDRAVARVDIYIQKAAGVTADLDDGTSVSLVNTYDEEYFVRDQSGNALFGPLQTVTSGFITQTWTQSASPTTEEKKIPESGEEARLICSFYTPERTCVAPGDADKLLVNINLKSSDGSTRNGTVMMDRFTQEGTEKNIEAIVRNNNYQITATLEEREITAGITVQIMNWIEKDIPVLW